MKLDILAFAAHPDDIELCAGGFLVKMAKKGYKTGVIDLTKGESGSFGPPEKRKIEAHKSAKILKLAIREILEMKDTNIEDTQDNRLILIEKIRYYKPKLILLPYWQDNHPDHVTTSILGEKACFYARLKKIKTLSTPHIVDMVLFYQLHEFITPNFVVDISNEFNLKMKSIQTYHSQFGLRKEYLERIKTKAKFCGSLIETQYGEAFISKTPLTINDPMLLC